MQILCDGHSQILEMSPGMQTVLNHPEVLGEPVFEGQTAVDDAGTFYATVLRDGGLFRMWYLPLPHDWCGPNTFYVGYAESDDGFHWRRPNCNLVEAFGTRNNGLMKWKKNRLIGYKANLPERITLQPGTDAPNRLVLNGQTRPEGTVRVRLVSEQDGKPLPGFDYENCEPLTGDFSAAQVRWKGQLCLPSTKGQIPFLTQIELDNATLWAFNFGN